MILFSSLKLERKLAENSLSSWDKAKYMIFVIILYTFQGPIFVLTPSFGPPRPLATYLISFVTTILVILVTYHGIKACFLTNKAADDTDFISRFAVLYVPMTFKFIAVILPISFLSFYIISFLKDEIHDKALIYFVYLSAPIGTYVFYLFLNRSFKRLGKLVSQA
jgi:hypothetical protein